MFSNLDQVKQKEIVDLLIATMTVTTIYYNSYD